MTNLTKHQHYVPQFYLREFASADSQLWVYDKLLDRKFRTSVRNVAGERYFYDSEEIERAVGAKQPVEKFLSAMESVFGHEMDQLLFRLRARLFTRLTAETRAAIAVFMSFQMIRTKEHRIAALQMLQQLRTFVAKHPKSEKLLKEIDDEMTEEAQKAFQARQLLDMPLILEFSQILCGHIWVITHRHKSHSFYTGDEPVTKRENVKIPFRGNSGIACKGIEIHLPLSHDFSIILYERSHFAKVEALDGTVFDLPSEQNMIYSRQFAVRYASRFVFCLEDDFDFAKLICREEPHWRASDRKRVTSNHDDIAP